MSWNDFDIAKPPENKKVVIVRIIKHKDGYVSKAVDKDIFVGGRWWSGRENNFKTYWIEEPTDEI